MRDKQQIVDICTSNINGNGECSFTNSGSPGSVCGHIFVACDGGANATGPRICSGKVDTNETKVVPFVFPDFGDLARPYGIRWGKHCFFTFILEDN